MPLSTGPAIARMHPLIKSIVQKTKIVCYIVKLSVTTCKYRVQGWLNHDALSAHISPLKMPGYTSPQLPIGPFDAITDPVPKEPPMSQ